MAKKLEATKDNLSEILSSSDPTPEDLERKAERTLLAITEPMSHGERLRFCNLNGIPWSEYKLIRHKYKHLLKKYRASLSKNPISGGKQDG